MSIKNQISQWDFIIATWFGSGRSPKAPGTVGSFFALPLAVVASWGHMYGILVACFFIFGIGWYSTHRVLKGQKETDPGFVVIDEVVGQTLTFLFVVSKGTLSIPTLIMGFILFRFFDIVKIWPASYFDKKIQNAFGVMMDDVVAGLYAALVLWGLQNLWIAFF